MAMDSQARQTQLYTMTQQGWRVREPDEVMAPWWHPPDGPALGTLCSITNCDAGSHLLVSRLCLSSSPTSSYLGTWSQALSLKISGCSKITCELLISQNKPPSVHFNERSLSLSQPVLVCVCVSSLLFKNFHRCDFVSLLCNVLLQEPKFPCMPCLDGINSEVSKRFTISR